MRVTLTASCLWAFLSVGWCQVSLPNPQYLPPDADAGAVKSNESSPNPQWSTLLGNLLYFYDAQRSGNLSSTNRVDWRNSSCEDDGEDVNLDLSGTLYFVGWRGPNTNVDLQEDITMLEVRIEHVSADFRVLKLLCRLHQGYISFGKS